MKNNTYSCDWSKNVSTSVKYLLDHYKVMNADQCRLNAKGVKKHLFFIYLS